MLNSKELLKHFSGSSPFGDLLHFLKGNSPGSLWLKGMAGSSAAMLAAAAILKLSRPWLFVLSDRESAAYFFNDLEQLLGEFGLRYEERDTFFFPSSFKKPFSQPEQDNARLLLRAEVVNRLATKQRNSIVVTYPEALCEKVISRQILRKNTMGLRQGEEVSVDFIMDLLIAYGFDMADFVVEAGQFSIRGGIIDVFSFSNDLPFRIEILGDQVESLRTFDPSSQVSVDTHETISILPDIRLLSEEGHTAESLLDSMPGNTLIWTEDISLCLEMVRQAFDQQHTDTESFTTADYILDKFSSSKLVEFRKPYLAKPDTDVVHFDFIPQPNFNKQFELLIQNLSANTRQGFRNFILFDTRQQVNRIQDIFSSLQATDQKNMEFKYDSILLSLHEGFTDRLTKTAYYTDHQIFERFHRYRLRDKFPGRRTLTLKSLFNLKPGDYVTHIDHGVGVFSGLEKIEVNGRIQEAIRLVYKNNDILYISIHSLHRISKFTGKEGVAPSLHRLGSGVWSKLKNKTKQKVKDIAHDLISLYAKRRAQQGFSFSPDSYLQHELEASFMFQDTPDQEKATVDVKKDMEASHPMDRLICGDVGFGKTEIAIRAAFKAVSDSKQVALLVPTTILALQHYHTFSDRLKDFPCTIDYVSRFRSSHEKKQTLQAAKEGKVDILIGTHRLLSKDVGFKDLGLLIIDEEQKFGVSAKEKLKNIRVNVDTLTLTATPIPRTLQFSLMGARDLSFINTPPPNRYPIITEVHVFSEDLIREAIMYEVSRGGQVFFVHNRVQNIEEVAAIIKKACPGVSIAVGHGQLEGGKLEKIMVEFIHGEYDVLVSTTIIESGLDIPNANTIIINNAHHFGLSDLHQMRGRVGRTNKKAFCYLLSQPLSTLTDEARKRLKAIEEFSELGSGFNIAMRDLDIRGAGNLLGAEQSGFISDIGFETYHKILDEAMAELREEEFRNLLPEDTPMPARARRECQLETDLELMIPSDYVASTEERVQLYKELDGIEQESDLQAFASRMKDRFGPLPPQVRGLFQAVRLRWLAAEAGFEKIILKSEKLIGYLPDSEQSDYYQGEMFGRIIQYTQANARRCQIRETDQKISLTIRQVEHIDVALDLIRDLSAVH